MLFYFFRRIKGMLLPFSVVLMSIIICFGTLPIFGWKLTLISILVPIMLIAVANDYGIHIIAKYQELNTVDCKLSSKEIISKTISSLWKPILITGITTVIGYSYYGSKCIAFLFGNKWKQPYRAVYTISLIPAAVISIDIVVNYVDGMFAVMGIPTMISTIILAPKVMLAAREYFTQLKFQRTNVLPD